MTKLLFLYFCFCLSSCSRIIYEPVVRTQRIVDTLVQQVADSTIFVAMFECDSARKVILRELESVKGATAVQTSDFRDGRLEIQTRWKTKIVDRMVEVHDTVTRVQVREVERVKKVVPTFFWCCFGLTILVLIYFAAKFF